MMKPIVLNKKIGSIVLIFSLLCFPIAAAAEAELRAARWSGGPSRRPAPGR